MVMQDKYTSLERLKALLDRGALTEEEFEREKALILYGNHGKKSSHHKLILTLFAVGIAVGLGALFASNIMPVSETGPVSTASIEATEATQETSAAPEALQSAPVDPYSGAKITGCRQSTCMWEKVLEIRTIKTVPNGILKVEDSYQGSMLAQGADFPTEYSAKLPIEWDRVQTYVFCSKQQPSTAFKDRGTKNGRWIGHLLDPFEPYGYNWGSAETYMRVCHNVDLGRQDIKKVMLRLGYRPGTRNEQVDLAKPTDLVALAKVETQSAS